MAPDMTHAELSAATDVLFRAVSDRGTEELEALLRSEGVLIACPSCNWNNVAGTGAPGDCTNCLHTLTEPVQSEADPHRGLK